MKLALERSYHTRARIDRNTELIAVAVEQPSGLITLRYTVQHFGKRFDQEATLPKAVLRHVGRFADALYEETYQGQ